MVPTPTLEMRLSGLVLASVLTACGAPPTPARAQAPAPPVGSIGEYAPLEDGTVLAYVTNSNRSNEAGLVVLQVRRPRPELIELDDGGHVERLYVEANGLRHATGGHWLVAPLEKGRCWMGRNAQTCITEAATAVEVPAGRFTRCLVTVETEGGVGAEKRTTTTFCPGVGMTLLVVEAEVEGEGAVEERAALRSFGPAVDLSAPQDQAAEGR